MHRIVADEPVVVSYSDSEPLTATQEIYAPGGDSVFLGDRVTRIRHSVFVVDHLRQAVFIRQRGEGKMIEYNSIDVCRQWYWQYVSDHPSHLTEATFPESILKEARDEALLYVRWCLLSTTTCASCLVSQ